MANIQLCAVKQHVSKKDISFCMLKEREFIWEIKIKKSPLLQKKCSHCNGDRFYCSDKFRINAQKRNIDVWLIYRCINCDNTYNMNILSRTKPELISKDLFRKFSTNDSDTARKYAFSPETGRKNDTKQDYKSVEYEIGENAVSIADILNMKDDMATIRIKTEFEIELKLSSIIKRGLGISANQFRRMFEKGIISTPDILHIKKQKVKNGDMVLVDINRLRKYFEE